MPSNPYFEKLFLNLSDPIGFSVLIPFVTRPAYRCAGRNRRGGCLSPATSGASSGASGRCGDGTANPKGSWHGRLLLVPFSCARKKINDVFKGKEILPNSEAKKKPGGRSPGRFNRILQAAPLQWSAPIRGLCRRSPPLRRSSPERRSGIWTE